MNILTGVLPRDGGTIKFDGQELEHITITQSEKMGIAFVHQELNLFNDLKVFENMFLNREYTNKFGSLDKKRMRREARELFERLGVEIDPDAVVADLKTSQKQLLEICKALHLKAKLIILDEPTTSLNNEKWITSSGFSENSNQRELHLYLSPTRCRKFSPWPTATRSSETASTSEKERSATRHRKRSQS